MKKVVAPLIILLLASVAFGSSLHKECCYVYDVEKNCFSEKASDKESILKSLKPESEALLKLSKWMFEEKNFDAFAAFFKAEMEPKTELETWMANEGNFGMFVYVTKETETELELKSWMVDEFIRE